MRCFILLLLVKANSMTRNRRSPCKLEKHLGVKNSPLIYNTAYKLLDVDNEQIWNLAENHKTKKNREKTIKKGLAHFVDKNKKNIGIDDTWNKNYDKKTKNNLNEIIRVSGMDMSATTEHKLSENYECEKAVRVDISKDSVKNEPLDNGVLEMLKEMEEYSKLVLSEKKDSEPVGTQDYDYPRALGTSVYDFSKIVEFEEKPVPENVVQHPEKKVRPCELSEEQKRGMADYDYPVHNFGFKIHESIVPKKVSPKRNNSKHLEAPITTCKKTMETLKREVDNNYDIPLEFSERRKISNRGRGRTVNEIPPVESKASKTEETCGVKLKGVEKSTPVSQQNAKESINKVYPTYTVPNKKLNLSILSSFDEEKKKKNIKFSVIYNDILRVPEWIIDGGDIFFMVEENLNMKIESLLSRILEVGPKEATSMKIKPFFLTAADQYQRIKKQPDNLSLLIDNLFCVESVKMEFYVKMKQELLSFIPKHKSFKIWNIFKQRKVSASEEMRNLSIWTENKNLILEIIKEINTYQALHEYKLLYYSTETQKIFQQSLSTLEILDNNSKDAIDNAKQILYQIK